MTRATLLPRPLLRPQLRLALAIAIVVLYVGAGGIAKLLGVPYVHSSFPKLGLPPRFGYFIGVCEVLGCLALPIRALSSPAALGLGAIMLGATYYHAAYTPAVQAVPPLLLALACAWICVARRRDFLAFDRS